MRKKRLETVAPEKIGPVRISKNNSKIPLTPMVGPTYHPACWNSLLDFDVMAVAV
jgi:hypothetical protein